MKKTLIAILIGLSTLSFSAALADTVSADSTPPSAPSNLIASVISSSQINLNWTAATDNIGVTGYQIFRNGAQIATTTGVLYNNTGLTASTTYIFTIKAFDAAGNVSIASNSVSAATQAQTGNYPKWQKYYDSQMEKITKRYNAELARLKKKTDKALSKTTDAEKIKKITEKYNQAVKKAGEKYNKNIEQLKKQMNKKLNNANGIKNGWWNNTRDKDEDKDN